jgi:hypothetical protein
MALSRNIPALHYSNSQWSPNENRIMKFGQSELACLMRALRLQNPYPRDSHEYLLWNEQSEINIPLLIQASLFLDLFCQTHHKTRVLFTSRDGCQWIQLFRLLFPKYDSIYFHSSRYVYTYPSPSYIKYVENLCTEKSVIVDLHGKGSTCSRFFKNHLNIEPTYLALINLSRKHHAIIRKTKALHEIEMINYDTLGTLYDFQDGAPLRCKPEYDLQYIRPMHACMEKCTAILSNYSFQKFDIRIIKWAIQSMESGLVLNKYIRHLRHHCHIMDQDTLHHVHLI